MSDRARLGTTHWAFPWAAWFLGALFFCLGFFQRVAPSVMVADLMRDFAASAAVLGNLSAFYFYAYAGLQLPVGVAVDHWGPRRVLTMAAVLCGAGTILFASAENLIVAFAGRLMIGAGAGFSFVGTLKIISVWFPVRRFALLSGLTMAAGMVGGIGGQAPLAAVVAWAGWRTPLAITGVFIFALAVVIWLVVRDRPAGAGDQEGETGHHLLAGLKYTVRMPQTWVNALFGTAMSAPMLAFGGLWGVPYMIQSHGLDRPTAAASVSLILVGFAIGSPAWGWFSDHIGRRKPPMLVAAIVSMGGIVGVVYIPGLPLVADQAMLFLSGLGSGGVVVAYAAAREHNPSFAAGATLGLVNMTTVASGALFQPVIGWLLDLTWEGDMVAGARTYSVIGYETSLLTLVGSGILGIILSLAVRETHCQPVEIQRQSS